MLAVEQLRKSFGSRAVLEDVSFAVQAGEVVGLVGESGSGKTTIARCVLGLERPSSGTIRVRQQPITVTVGPRPWRRHIQMVAQDPRTSLDPRWTIGRSIGEPLDNWFPQLTDIERRQWIEQLAVQVRLEIALFERYPHELSTGECQRACIARALASRPEVVVFDEPLSALDVTIQADLLDLIRTVKAARGLGCLFISHDLLVLAEICDRILVLDGGRIVEEAPARQLVSDPRHPFTRELIHDTPRLAWTVWKA